MCWHQSGATVAPANTCTSVCLLDVMPPFCHASLFYPPPPPTRNTNTPVAPLNNVIVAPPPSPHSKLSLNHLKISQGGLSLVMLCRPRRSARRESRFDPPLARSGAATPCSVRVGTRRQLLEQQKKKQKKKNARFGSGVGVFRGPRHRLQSCTSPDTL